MFPSTQVAESKVGSEAVKTRTSYPLLELEPNRFLPIFEGTPVGGEKGEVVRPGERNIVPDEGTHEVLRSAQHVGERSAGSPLSRFHQSVHLFETSEHGDL